MTGNPEYEKGEAHGNSRWSLYGLRIDLPKWKDVCGDNVTKA